MKKWLPDELEEIPCDFCGSMEVSGSFMRADGMRVVECGMCGLAYLNPRPKEEFIMNFYGEDYFNGTSADRGEGGLRVQVTTPNEKIVPESSAISRPLKLLEENFGGLKGKSVLEIGCATGSLLSLAEKAGAEVCGLEISNYASQIARERGLNVITGTLDKPLSINDKMFDIVMAFEVIEHVLSPKVFIRNAAKMVKNHGLLLVSTPNFACAQRFGEEWFGFNFSYEHLYFFSIDVLKRMAHKSDLQLKYWETSAFQGGPIKKENFFVRQVSRVHKVSLLINEYGLISGIMKFINKEQIYKPYGSGHTLFAIFEKNSK